MDVYNAHLVLSNWVIACICDDAREFCSSTCVCKCVIRKYLSNNCIRLLCTKGIKFSGVLLSLSIKNQKSKYFWNQSAQWHNSAKDGLLLIITVVLNQKILSQLFSCNTPGNSGKCHSIFYSNESKIFTCQSRGGYHGLKIFALFFDIV